MSDFNNCRKCGKATAINDDGRCAGCGELICLDCGCTETRACVDEAGTPCGWARKGICTACAGGNGEA